MRRRMHRALLVVFGRLPRLLRINVVRVLTPSYRVGAACVIRRPDGRILLVRQSYRRSWGLPGGLLNRHEMPRDAAIREVREETGLVVELDGTPALVVEPRRRRIDIVYRAVIADDGDADQARPSSPEIDHLAWWNAHDLPALQPETHSAFRALGADDQEVRSTEEA